MTPPYLPVETQTYPPRGGDPPRFHPPSVYPGIPGLLAASGGTPGSSGRRRPLNFPIDSQFSSWNDCTYVDPGPKFTPNSKFFGRNCCILQSFELSPHAKMVQNHRKTNGFCMILNIRYCTD